MDRKGKSRASRGRPIGEVQGRVSMVITCNNIGVCGLELTSTPPSFRTSPLGASPAAVQQAVSDYLLVEWPRWLMTYE